MSNEPTPTESQKIIGSFAPHWALIDEGLEVDWSVEEVRKQAWELINALADQLDFYRRVLVGVTVVDEAMIQRAAAAIDAEVKKWPVPPPSGMVEPGWWGASTREIAKAAIDAALEMIE